MLWHAHRHTVRAVRGKFILVRLVLAWVILWQLLEGSNCVLIAPIIEFVSLINTRSPVRHLMQYQRIEEFLQEALVLLDQVFHHVQWNVLFIFGRISKSHINYAVASRAHQCQVRVLVNV